MFDFLKKKFKEWTKPDSSSSKSSKKSKKSEKKTSPPSKKSEKKEKKVIKTINEKIQDKEAEKIIEEAESSPPEIQEVQEEKKENFFSKLIKKLSHHQITQQEFDEIFEEFEITLLENNVAIEAVDKIKSSLSSQLVGQEIKAQEVEARVLLALKDSILSVLI